MAVITNATKTENARCETCDWRANVHAQQAASTHAVQTGHVTRFSILTTGVVTYGRKK